MFYGEYEHTLDKKGRLIIPSKFRESAKEQEIERFFITRGLDGCLFVFAEDEWRSQEQKFKTASFTKPDVRKFNRLFFSGAVEAATDKQGRILIPAYLKDFAGIKRDIIIVGVSNRFEIWAKERWGEYYKSAEDSFESVAEKLIE
ncbi:MAG: division/cell wall cluster transcriptional repressor MraZ [Candidatus Omnitrophica bacterium]|nr:division/cell wall cluster transcriptional repressor MraZ [Candidatus Omnitrophota bacterium]